MNVGLTIPHDDGKRKLHVHRWLCKIGRARALADRFNSESSFANETGYLSTRNRRSNRRTITIVRIENLFPGVAIEGNSHGWNLPRTSLFSFRIFASFCALCSGPSCTKDTAFHVASLSRGAADNNLEALKTNGNFCDMTRHGIFENAS
jgi:hypothetical protein